MIERNGTDTTIGWVPGAQTANSSTGEGQRAMLAAADWGGWASTPELGVYTYPSGGPNETWVWKSSGDGPASIRGFAIPSGYDLGDVRAGRCDAIWRQRAVDIVSAGLGGRCRYFPGYEGDQGNFNGSAGSIGVDGWSEAISRQLAVMRDVDGFDPWVGINYCVHEGRRAGQDPDRAYAGITEPFQSVDLDWYDTDDFSGHYPITDVARCIDFMHAIYEAQLVVAQRYGLPMGFGEWGPLWRSDGHGGGDRVEVLAAALDWIKAHDVSHVVVYDGINMPGDDGRFADYIADGARSGNPGRPRAASVHYQAAARYPTVAPWVQANLDPAAFVGRDTPPPTDDLAGRVTALEDWRRRTGEIASGPSDGINGGRVPGKRYEQGRTST